MAWWRWAREDALQVSWAESCKVIVFLGAFRCHGGYEERYWVVILVQLGIRNVHLGGVGEGGCISRDLGDGRGGVVEMGEGRCIASELGI